MNEIDKATQLLRSGFILKLREATGVSRNFVAYCLNIQADRVKAWETGLFTTVARGTATKVLLLHQDYLDATLYLAERRINWNQMISRREAAMGLGIGTYALDHRMERRMFKYTDFNVLGLWLTRDALEYLK